VFSPHNSRDECIARRLFFIAQRPLLLFETHNGRLSSSLMMPHIVLR
jgi:hypothetical protein